MRSELDAPGAPVTDWVERAALGASLLCLIHCAGLPLLLAALAVLSRVIELPEAFHLWALGFAVPVSSTALLAGLRDHRHLLPPAAGCVGMAGLAAGALLLPGGALETAATLGGSLFLAAAHLANW
ncbi:MAG: MerC domain-containing protein, partial [Sphingomonas sp.]